MAKATCTVIVDGQTYHAGEEIHDLGSWECTAIKEAPNGELRHYEGLATDLSKLPHYVPTGSSAYCYDTMKTYKFNSFTNQWYDVTTPTA